MIGGRWESWGLRPAAGEEVGLAASPKPAPLPPGTWMLRPAVQTEVRGQPFLENKQSELILSVGCKL